MVVHVLTAERYHLVPGIVKGFLTAYANDTEHRFLLLGTEKLDESLYENIFQEKSFTDYSFIYSKRQLIKALWLNRHNAILMHGEKYLYLIIIVSFLFGNTNINWVCWGSAAKINRSGKSKLFTPFKLFLYHRLSSINTLMEDDRKTIMEDFSISPEIINTIPYASGGDLNIRDQACQRIRKEPAPSHQDKTRVLLGNNTGNIPYYHELIDKLASFKGNVEVHCMLNYSLDKDTEYDRLVEHGKSVFNQDFILDEDFHSDPEDFIRYMNYYDVYICGNPAQTGLGALYTILQLGKKIYVTGKNYSWLREGLNTIVYEIKEIGSYEDFIKSLTEDEKNQNNDNILNYKKQSPLMWHKYLNSLNQSK